MPYLDRELCGLLTDGRTAFNLIQNATDTGQGALVFFLFDLLHLEGEDLTSLPLVDRKTRLASLLNGAPNSLRYNDQIGHGPAFHRLACERGLEGIVSKRANGRYEPDRRTWLKIKCLKNQLHEVGDGPLVTLLTEAKGDLDTIPIDWAKMGLPDPTIELDKFLNLFDAS